MGQKLAARSHRPDLQWHFSVVDAPIVNAFALPGGFIYLTRQILAFMNNEAEMAGVLGHEIGHVTARHSVSQITKAQLTQIGLGVGSILSPTVGQLSGAAQAGLSLLFLKYGRHDERQADQLGVDYMAEAGYDPYQLSRFFEVFQGLSEESGRSIPDWLSSHPAPPDRITATASKAALLEAPAGSDGWMVGRQRFLSAIDGLVYGANPREGFEQEGYFVHPDLRFRIRFPAGWPVQNTKSSVISAHPQGAAVLRLRLAPEQVGPQQRATQLSRQSGVTLSQGRSLRIHGNPAYLAAYRVRDERGGQISALVAFISYREACTRWRD